MFGRIYLKNTYGIEKPAIGLLNIGTEPTKGNELIKETYQILANESENCFIDLCNGLTTSWLSTSAIPP